MATVLGTAIGVISMGRPLPVGCAAGFQSDRLLVRTVPIMEGSGERSRAYCASSSSSAMAYLEAARQYIYCASRDRRG